MQFVSASKKSQYAFMVNTNVNLNCFKYESKSMTLPDVSVLFASNPNIRKAINFGFNVNRHLIISSQIHSNCQVI